MAKTQTKRKYTKRKTHFDDPVVEPDKKTGILDDMLKHKKQSELVVEVIAPFINLLSAALDKGTIDNKQFVSMLGIVVSWL